VKYILQYTNGYREKFFLVRTGLQWPHDARFRLIEETTPIRDLARQFDSEEDARTTIASAGAPSGWEVVAA